MLREISNNESNLGGGALGSRSLLPHYTVNTGHSGGESDYDEEGVPQNEKAQDLMVAGCLGESREDQDES